MSAAPPGPFWQLGVGQRGRSTLSTAADLRDEATVRAAMDSGAMCLSHAGALAHDSAGTPL